MSSSFFETCKGRQQHNQDEFQNVKHNGAALELSAAYILLVQKLYYLIMILSINNNNFVQHVVSYLVNLPSGLHDSVDEGPFVYTY